LTDGEDIVPLEHQRRHYPSHNSTLFIYSRIDNQVGRSKPRDYHFRPVCCDVLAIHFARPARRDVRAGFSLWAKMTGKSETSVH
jgi:hypothetical protein